MAGTAPASPTSLVPAISALTVDLFSGAASGGAAMC
jgi:hypothetical protein